MELEGLKQTSAKEDGHHEESFGEAELTDNDHQESQVPENAPATIALAPGGPEHDRVSEPSNQLAEAVFGIDMATQAHGSVSSMESTGHTTRSI